MFVKRERYLEKIRPFYYLAVIKVLTGVRRCGKSILLKQIEEEFIENGFDKTHIIKIDFEDFRFSSIKTDRQLYSYIEERIKDDQKYLIFLDEIQHVKQFENVLISLRATKNCSVFITGSNSKLLSGAMASLLVGRCIEFKIMPFSFLESYQYLSKENNVDPYLLINDYIKRGGFPLRFSFKREIDTKRYIEQLYEGIIQKDIIKEKSKINVERLTHFSKYIMSNTGKDFSSVNIENYFKSTNKDTFDKKIIYDYLNKIEKACLISRVKRFDIVGKKSLLYIEKPYSMDTGLSTINTNLVNFEDTFYLENIIYNELISRDYEVFVGKTYKGEIDFVAIKEKKKCFIQVSYYLATQQIIDREFKAFSPINDASPKYVLSLDRLDYSRDGITHLNIVDFLLGKVDITLS